MLFQRKHSEIAAPRRGVRTAKFRNSNFEIRIFFAISVPLYLKILAACANFTAVEDSLIRICLPQRRKEAKKESLSFRPKGEILVSSKARNLLLRSLAFARDDWLWSVTLASFAVFARDTIFSYLLLVGKIQVCLARSPPQAPYAPRCCAQAALICPGRVGPVSLRGQIELAARRQSPNPISKSISNKLIRCGNARRDSRIERRYPTNKRPVSLWQGLFGNRNTPSSSAFRPQKQRLESV